MCSYGLAPASRYRSLRAGLTLRRHQHRTSGLTAVQTPPPVAPAYSHEVDSRTSVALLQLLETSSLPQPGAGAMPEDGANRLAKAPEGGATRLGAGGDGTTRVVVPRSHLDLKRRWMGRGRGHGVGVVVVVAITVGITVVVITVVVVVVVVITVVGITVVGITVVVITVVVVVSRLVIGLFRRLPSGPADSSCLFLSAA